MVEACSRRNWDTFLPAQYKPGNTLFKYLRSQGIKRIKLWTKRTFHKHLMFFCVHVLVFMKAHAHLCPYVWKPEVNLGHHSSWDTHRTPSDRLSHWSQGLTKQAGWLGQPTLGLQHSPLLPYHWAYNHAAPFEKNILGGFWDLNLSPCAGEASGLLTEPLSKLSHILFFLRVNRTVLLLLLLFCN